MIVFPETHLYYKYPPLSDDIICDVEQQCKIITFSALLIRYEFEKDDSQAEP